ncbi:MAG TPA: tripartite tricarboxylate transporter substrate binding protein [Ramlibacter sp.]|uniref:Bug family tripartite tricarboxylate transporter substrate binding protein n=1 Tax=Ramlibacter sp. TaxID=1917967 RepID=UPI002B9E1FFF|nr:tripartite tricarboxylate transporter substrate binding protein [Ramlibacter sp.]HVZ43575.1 tripartite tricarboxylate transporter substrate binding protein [Ramlibacter sp.]
MKHFQPTRRRAVAAIASALGAASGVVPFTSALAQAQTYPDRPIRLFVGYSAGGGTDQVARLVGQKLSELLGQQIVIVNQPGATGAIAVEKVATAAPDGYTLLLISIADTVVPALRAKLPYDLEKDIVGVAPVVGGPLALVVNPSLPVKNVKDLIALAQSKPGKLNYGSPGVGNSLHIAGEQFKLATKTDMLHVPFKGAAEAITATVAGQVDVCFPVLSNALPLVESGKLRLLAVTGAKRSPSLPNVPTVAESGVPGYDRTTWFGVAAPAATPKPVIAKLNEAINKVMSTAEMRDFYAKQNFEPMTGSAEQFNAFVHSEIAQSAAVIRALGIKPE